MSKVMTVIFTTGDVNRHENVVDWIVVGDTVRSQTTLGPINLPGSAPRVLITLLDGTTITHMMHAIRTIRVEN